jgi:hypothetical protein
VIVLLLIIGILCGLTFLLNACVAFFTQGIQLLFNGGTFFLYN